MEQGFELCPPSASTGSRSLRRRHLARPHTNSRSSSAKSASYGTAIRLRSMSLRIWQTLSAGFLSRAASRSVNYASLRHIETALNMGCEPLATTDREAIVETVVRWASRRRNCRAARKQRRLTTRCKPGTKRFETALPLTISFPLRAESEAAAHHRRRKRQIDIEPSFPVVMAIEYRIRRYRNADGTISRLRESLRGVDRT